MSVTHPIEDEYTAAMERHGTDAWTTDDQKVQERWLADRQGEVQAEEPAPKKTEK